MNRKIEIENIRKIRSLLNISKIWEGFSLVKKEQKLLDLLESFYKPIKNQIINQKEFDEQCGELEFFLEKTGLNLNEYIDSDLSGYIKKKEELAKKTGEKVFFITISFNDCNFVVEVLAITDIWVNKSSGKTTCYPYFSLFRDCPRFRREIVGYFTKY